MNRDDFSTEGEYRLQLFKDLIEIVKELGWDIGLPKVGPDDEVPGMIIGQSSYVKKVTEAYDARQKLRKAKT